MRNLGKMLIGIGIGLISGVSSCSEKREQPVQLERERLEKIKKRIEPERKYFALRESEEINSYSFL